MVNLQDIVVWFSEHFYAKRLRQHWEQVIGVNDFLCYSRGVNGNFISTLCGIIYLQINVNYLTFYLKINLLSFYSSSTCQLQFSTEFQEWYLFCEDNQIVCLLFIIRQRSFLVPKISWLTFRWNLLVVSIRKSTFKNITSFGHGELRFLFRVAVNPNSASCNSFSIS